MAAHKHAGELLWTEEPYVQVLDDALIHAAQHTDPFLETVFFRIQMATRSSRRPSSAPDMRREPSPARRVPSIDGRLFKYAASGAQTAELHAASHTCMGFPRCGTGSSR